MTTPAATTPGVGRESRQFLWLLPLLLLLGPATASAEDVIVQGIDAIGGAIPLADGLKLLLLMTLAALAPAVVIAMTSFTRTIIVLAMLRHAFGMPDTPPAMVLVSLALFLTIFTTGPALQESYEAALVPLAADEISLDEAVVRGLQPLRNFMVRQTRESDLGLVLDIGGAGIPETVNDVGTAYLVPAFLMSELKTAFQIGFVIFLPFLLLDLVVASILMSMGMFMVPPTVISLPFKVLMFVFIDGWALVIGALLGSFR